MNISRSIQTTRPLARGRSTSQQRTNQQAFMAMAVMLALVLTAQVDRAKRQSLLAAFAPLEQQNRRRFFVNSLEQGQYPVTSLVFWSRATFRGSTLVLHQTPTMPRARGKPRRGAAWYTAESRRQRKKNFEKAIAMAARRRNKTPRTPPMAYVEEVIPEEGMESVPEHMLFTVPDNWNPPSDFGPDSKPPPARILAGPNATRFEEPFPTCYVEEETPPEPPREATRQAHNQQVHIHQEAAGTTPTESIDSHSQEQPFLADLGCLNLIFEVRSLLDDQIFRLARIDQRLDMLFAAHSRTLPKRQCPTCARAYAFPAGWRQPEDEDKCAGSKVN
jgi:hypothetical protein